MSNVDISVSSHSFLIWQALSVARTAGGPVDLGKIEEMDRELTKVVDDLDRAVNIHSTLRIRV